MPYIGANKQCADISAAYSFITSKLAAMGWVLHDDIAAQNKVYKSNGADGAKLYGYVRIYVASTYYLYVEPWLQWNAATHVGTCTTYNVANSYICLSAASRVGVYGDADLVLIWAPVASKNFLFGHLPMQFLTSPKATLSSSATAGSNIAITVDSTADFGAGRYYCLVGQNYEGRDRIQVASITDATHMVISSLPRNYGSGAVIAPLPVAFGVMASQIGSSAMYPVVHPDHSGTATGGNGSYFSFQVMSGAPISVPDAMQGPRYIILPIFWSITGTVTGSMVGAANGNILCVYCGAGTLSADDILGVYTGNNVPVGGNVSELAGANTLTCATAGWTINAYADWFVYINSGTGVGQVRSIAGNTAIVLTVNDNWATPPDSTSTFKLMEQAWRATAMAAVPYGMCTALESTFA